jgi:predicted Zn finger-like uncharacterized protein
MFEVLRECGALARLLPEVDRLWGVPQRAEYHPEVDTGVHLMMVLDMARAGCAAAGALCLPGHDLGKGTTPADVLPRHIGHEERSARLLRGVRSACEGAGPSAASWPTWWRASTATSTAAASFGAAALVRLLERCDALRKPERLPRCCWPANATRAAGWACRSSPYPQRPRLLAALAAAQSVVTSVIAQQAAGRRRQGARRWARNDPPCARCRRGGRPAHGLVRLNPRVAPIVCGVWHGFCGAVHHRQRRHRAVGAAPLPVLLGHAELIANQASCPSCDEYGRFEVVDEDRRAQRMQVRCRKCTGLWQIED